VNPNPAKRIHEHKLFEDDLLPPDSAQKYWNKLLLQAEAGELKQPLQEQGEHTAIPIADTPPTTAVASQKTDVKTISFAQDTRDTEIRRENKVRKAFECKEPFRIEREPSFEGQPVVEGKDGIYGIGRNWWKTSKRTKMRYRPVRLAEFMKSRSIQAIACGESHCLLLDTTSRVLAFGSNRYGQLGVGEDVKHQQNPSVVPMLPPIVHIAAGFEYSGVTSMDGNAYMFGRNDFAQLGLGLKSETPVFIPKRMARPTDSSRWKRLFLGEFHSAALTDKDSCFLWGKGDLGALGFGDLKDALEPRLNRFLQTQSIVHIALGGDHSMALTKSGVVFSWGANDFFQTGHEIAKSLEIENREISSLPRGLSTLQEQLKIVQIACGYQHTIALSENGMVVIFGDNRNTQCSFPNREHKREFHFIDTRDPLFGGEEVVSVNASLQGSFLLTSAGNVWGTGRPFWDKRGQNATMLLHKLNLNARVVEFVTSSGSEFAVLRVDPQRSVPERPIVPAVLDIYSNFSQGASLESRFKVVLQKLSKVDTARVGWIRKLERSKSPNKIPVEQDNAGRDRA
jgi:alpha-tubulin suppressor-like RCC1 family protein